MKDELRKVKEMNEKMLKEIQNVTNIVKELKNNTNVASTEAQRGRLHFLERTN